MRVLVLVTAFDRSENDVITPWLTQTVAQLADRGIECEVLAPSYRGLGDHQIRGVRVNRFRYAPPSWETMTHDQTAPDRILSRPWYLALVPTYLVAGTYVARRLLRERKFDLIHAHWPLPHSLMALAAARRPRVPVVSSFHGVELTLVRNRLPILRPLLREVIRRSDAVTANSRYTAKLVRAVYDCPVDRIPFGAAVGAPGPTRNALERAPGSPRRVLFVGRLVERKGLKDLLDAFTGLDDLAPELEIVGDGPLRSILEAQVERLGLTRRVHFRGFVSQRELSEAYARADVFVLPAVRDSKGDVEGLGVVLIEALAAGIPVIASDAGGIPDIVRDGRTGLLVSPGRPEELSEAIRAVLTNPQLATQLARQGRRHVDAEFSWDAVIDDLVAVYERVLNRRR